MASHLQDVGLIARTLLSDKAFQRGFRDRVAEYYPGERQREAGELFEPAMLDRVQLGLHLHDIGKLHQEIHQLIHQAGRPTEEERTWIERHTGVQKVLTQLGVSDPVIIRIAMYHHAPNYFGGNPYANGKGNLFS